MSTVLVYRFVKPSRGDIIVFSQSEDTHYSVKRIVGLPGETVQIKEGKILIDGEELTKDVSASDIAYAGLAEEPVELSADEYFVIGDNHTASDDSRVPGVGNIRRTIFTERRGLSPGRGKIWDLSENREERYTYIY